MTRQVTVEPFGKDLKDKSHMKSLASSILSWESLDRELASKEMQSRQMLKPPKDKSREPHGGCQVNGPKVAKFLDR